jgi:hypothetical protein
MSRKREAWSVTAKGVTVAAVAELELAFEVGAPQSVGAIDRDGGVPAARTSRCWSVPSFNAARHGCLKQDVVAGPLVSSLGAADHRG